MKSTEYPPLCPALTVHDAAAALTFYKAAFDAVELFRLTDPDSGKIGHAEMTLAGSVFFLADEYPEFNKSAKTLGGTPVRLSLMVDDVDAAFERAVAAGAAAVRPPADQFYGHRCANVRDPFGHEWMLAKEFEKVSPAEMQNRWNAMSKKEQS